jgi:carbon-monoxide dehydrogenase medium subunit
MDFLRSHQERRLAMSEALYFAASTMSEAMKLLGQYGKKAVILAGGTDLVPRINTYGLKPGALIYVGKLGLDYIKEEKGRMIIGAATPMAKIAGSKAVAKKAAALSEAALQAGTAAVRTAGTIGGNLANASPAADLATPLLVLDADLSLVSQKKKRMVALKDFFKGPGQTVLQPGEMIKEVSFPIPKGKTVFVKLGRRKALTLSVVNAAVRLEVNRKKCQEARIALGSVAPTPLRCPKAEGMLKDQEISKDLILQCASEAMAASSPIDDQRASAWYRKKAGAAVVAKALAKAAGLEME